MDFLLYLFRQWFKFLKGILRILLEEKYNFVILWALLFLAWPIKSGALSVYLKGENHVLGKNTRLMTMLMREQRELKKP